MRVVSSGLTNKIQNLHLFPIVWNDLKPLREDLTMPPDVSNVREETHLLGYNRIVYSELTQLSVLPLDTLTLNR